MIHEDESLRDRDAELSLAELVDGHVGDDALLLAIPAGGVPVAARAERPSAELLASAEPPGRDGSRPLTRSGRACPARGARS
jgi:hypothetical protein